MRLETTQQEVLAYLPDSEYRSGEHGLGVSISSIFRGPVMELADTRNIVALDFVHNIRHEESARGDMLKNSVFNKEFLEYVDAFDYDLMEVEMFLNNESTFNQVNGITTFISGGESSDMVDAPLDAKVQKDGVVQPPAVPIDTPRSAVRNLFKFIALTSSGVHEYEAEHHSHAH